MAWHHAEDWRWDPRYHSTPTTATIAVSGLSAEQTAEREKKLKQGAHLVPFGFARVLQPAPESPQPDIPQPDIESPQPDIPQRAAALGGRRLVTSPRVIGLLSWFEELPEFLVTTIRTAAPLLDHLVAVDGRYANFPGDVAASDPEQIAAIVYTCREHGIALSVHVPTEPWESEVAKRTRLFELGLDVADIGRSWLWVLDGDGFTTQLDITPDEVLALEHDVAEVRFIDPAEYADIRIRNLFRARPGLHVGPINHYTYRDGDGRVLWGRGEIEAADLGDRITMQHANHLRDEIRRQAGQAYYLRRTELGLEVGDCERCGERKASRSLPHRWRREGGRLRGEFGEFCDQCIHAIRRTNRASLALHGQDETMTVWINQQQFQLKALYWNWSHVLTGAGWQIPDRVARRYDALLDRGDHQQASELIEPYRPAPRQETPA
jgi:hypothetical protein